MFSTAKNLNKINSILCLTVFFPGFAVVTNSAPVAPVLSDQEICNQILPPNSLAHQQHQQMYASLSIEELKRQISLLEQHYINFQQLLDRGNALADISAFYQDISTAPKKTKQKKLSFSKLCSDLHKPNCVPKSNSSHLAAILTNCKI